MRTPASPHTGLVLACGVAVRAPLYVLISQPAAISGLLPRATGARFERRGVLQGREKVEPVRPENDADKPYNFKQR